MLFLRIRLLVFAAALALVPPRDARGSDTMLLEFGVAPVALSSAPAFGAQGARATAVSAGWLLSTRHALPWSGRQELSVTLLSDTGGALSHKGWAAAGSVPASGDL